MKLFVLVPGFGDPHWDTKVDILRRNVATVSTYFTEYVFYIIQYTEDKNLPEDLLENPNIEVVYDQGILGKNIHKHAHPQMIDCHNPDYVMILLDDIELEVPFDWSHLISLQKEHDLDIVSPTLVSSAMSYWNFMIKSDNPSLLANVTTRCELFCYFMTPDAYDTYYRYCDPENPWMWGMDFILRTHMNLRVAISQRLGMIHHFWRSEDTHDPRHCPRKDCTTYLAKHGTTWDELYMIPTVYELIHE